MEVENFKMEVITKDTDLCSYPWWKYHCGGLIVSRLKLPANVLGFKKPSAEVSEPTSLEVSERTGGALAGARTENRSMPIAGGRNGGFSGGAAGQNQAAFPTD